MYRYISAAVSLENLRQQVAKPIFDQFTEFPSQGEDLFKILVNIDPTADYDSNKGGKYVPWVIRQYLKGNLDEKDFTNLRDALKHFAIQPKKYEHSDLGQYKTVEEFLTDAERVGNMPLTEKEKARQLKKNAHKASTEDKEFVTSDGVWELWIPKTHAGSISLAREGGTKARWCTAYEGNDHYWKSYTEGYHAGTLYIFLNTSNPNEKYQLHFESNSWFDIEDDSLGMEKFYEFIADKPNFAAYFQVVNENGLLKRAGTVVGVDPDVTELVIPDDIDKLSIGGFPEGIKSIIYPDNWTKWSGPRLEDLANLQYVHLPDNLNVLPSNTIAGCVSLTKVDFPSKLTEIQSGNFSGCDSLAKIDLPDSITDIGQKCFMGTSISTFVFPPAIQVVPPKMFDTWTELEYVDLYNATIIRSQAFFNAEVGVVNNLDKVTKFYAESFKNSTLSDLTLSPDALIGSYAFQDCKYLTGTITLTDSMKLGIGCFDGCTELTINWARADEDYEFDEIKKLICSNTCKQLIEANKGYIEIETIEGDHYDAEV